ncbi:hypothetical protein Acsp03_54120 [Actinomadura sp. NBRC 104412]|uniref:hypothetical protein n=1 Tax=Actinomadura sp. NBRC 104412 TaxID=3032203 RepID=UPI0024A58E07|nr:hypothetical protein [Actinomadura sp. NBRC 104412]GLZ07946.1 hypothetical protein Acsp03_54120 [Actinomadura sp. NBRC 104412]
MDRSNRHVFDWSNAPARAVAFHADAAPAVLDVVEREDLPARARERGRHLHERLTDLQDRHEQIGDVRAT